MPASSDLPAWAAPYLPAFRDALRAVRLSTGFTLLPVEVTGADVVRALARWLAGEGVRAALVEPRSEEAWEQAASDLEAEKDPDVVILLGDRRSTPAMLSALRVLNQRRDALARKLSCPLMWCGPPDFLRLTWERAPDLWSVRALTLALESPATRAHEAPLWPLAPVDEPPERLEELMEAAHRQGDAPNEGRIGAMLVESYLARGDLHAADRLLRRLEARGALPADAELAKGALLAMRGDVGAAAAAVGRAKADARRDIALGNLALDDDARRAAELYESARAAASASGSRTTEAIALADAGIAAMKDDLDVSHDRLEEALAIFRATSDERNEARVLARLGGAHLAWRDSRRACEYLEEALARFRDLGDLRGEAEVLLRLAQSYLDVGDPEKARDDAERALSIARATADDAASREALALLDHARAELSS